MKLIIAGDTEFEDSQTLFDKINQVNQFEEITEVICGGLRGVDTIGRQWAMANSVPVKLIVAKASNRDNAIVKRNEEMVTYADAALIIWNGENQVTKNIIETLINLKKPYHLATYEV